MNGNETPPSNTLGKASLVLGIIATTFVFSIGLCAGVGQQQGWLKAVGVLLFLLGGTFAFVGLLGAVLGFLGLFSRKRLVAFVGLLLGMLAVLMFVAILNATR